MLTIPYRMSTLGAIQPGDVVEHPEDGTPLYVDEVRRRGDGLTIFGWPGVEAQTRRRVAVEGEPTTRVRVRPDLAQRVRLGEAIFDAFNRAHASEVQDAESHGEGWLPSFNTDPVSRELVVRVRGTEWRLSLTPDFVPPEPGEDLTL